ncbi:hypothetical protein DFH28DRAFT_1123919 [Melampsora americana]|nr:hypothetical protein DFH28DRAFT_1123919 [Melampsora americana]
MVKLAYLKQLKTASQDGTLKRTARSLETIPNVRANRFPCSTIWLRWQRAIKQLKATKSNSAHPHSLSPNSSESDIPYTWQPLQPMSGHNSSSLDHKSAANRHAVKLFTADTYLNTPAGICDEWVLFEITS